MAALAQTIWQATAPPQVASLAFGVTAYLVAILLGGAAVGLAQSPLLPDAGRWRRRWVASTSLGALAFWVILAGGLVVLGGGWTATNALVGSALQVSTMPLLVAGGTLGGLAYGLTTAPTLGRIDPERTTRDALRPLPTTSPYG
jgi:hypothetical protein